MAMPLRLPIHGIQTEHTRDMRSEQTKSPANRESISDDPLRSVNVKRTKSATLISVSCSVKGSVCFVRAGKSGQGSWLIRLFGLLPPEPFSDDVVVFGLGGRALDAVRSDREVADAVSALLKSGTRLSLQGNKLTATVSKSSNAATTQALTVLVRAAAAGIERLVGESVNDAIGTDRLGRPYMLFSTLAAVVFGVCFALLKPSLTPLTIVPYSLAAASVFAVVTIAFVLPMHLRRNALGGAIVPYATISSIIGSLMLGASLAMIANTFLGERLLVARDIPMTGTIGVTHGKHASCWLALDIPSPDLVPRELIARLPLNCSEVHYHEDPIPGLYDVKLNPGLLGAPFVQSIQRMQPTYAPASVIPCHYGLPTEAMPGLPPQKLFAAVRASLNARGEVTSVVLEKSSGNSTFDDLALSQSRKATCKPFLAPDGKAVPIETNFLFTALPSELRADPASETLAARIARRVRAHIDWNGPFTGLSTIISVHCGSDGKLLSASIVKSSGNRAWDAAALAAVEHADPMPTDSNGKSVEHFTITVQPGPA